MNPSIVTGPLVEPISLSDAKAHLRVDGSDEDVYISVLVSTARRWIESTYGVALVPQVWEYSLSGFPCGDVIRIPKPPLLRVTSVKYHSEDLTTVSTFSSGSYQVDTRENLVALKPGSSWPTESLRESSGVVIRFVAGFATSATPVDADDPTDYTADVPEEFKHAIKMIVGDMYAHRESEVTGTIVSQFRFDPDMLIGDYRDWRIY